MRFRKHILIGMMLLFAAAQLFFIAKRVHNYPFMIYDMYSRPDPGTSPHSVLVVITDGDTLDLSGLPMFREGTILNSLRLYEYHLAYGADPWDPALTSRQQRAGSMRVTKRSDRLLRNRDAQLDRYPEWLREYIEKTLRRPVNRLEVHRLYYRAGEENPFEGRPLLRTGAHARHFQELHDFRQDHPPV